MDGRIWCPSELTKLACISCIDRVSTRVPQTEGGEHRGAQAGCEAVGSLAIGQESRGCGSPRVSWGCGVRHWRWVVCSDVRL